MILEAYAKINWSLDITGQRPDGYHYMDMLMQPVSLPDEITIVPSPVMKITTSGYPRSRADESNLAYRAAEILKQRTQFPGSVHIHVHKQIPMCAGMGGGSADAAAVLVGLNRLWNTGLSSSDLEETGLRLGADVPFLIRGGLARVRGIGEELESCPCDHNYWLIIVQPCSGLSTAQIFSRWREAVPAVRPDTEKALSALQAGNLPALARLISNVLQPVSEAVRPEIAQACSDLVSEGAVVSSMTGSGSAVFGVFPSFVSAKKAYGRLVSRYRTIFVCHTQHDSIRIVQDEESKI